jgi:hypothetical protein
MARRLEDIIKSERAGPNFFHDEDIHCAKLLLMDLKEAAKGASIDESLALNIGLFHPAGSKGSKSKTRKREITDPASSLEKLIEFVKDLSRSRPLDKRELEMASKLRNLFLKIYEDGGTTAYEQYVSLEFSP